MSWSTGLILNALYIAFRAETVGYGNYQGQVWLESGSWTSWTLDSTRKAPKLHPARRPSGKGQSPTAPRLIDLYWRYVGARWCTAI